MNGYSSTDFWRSAEMVALGVSAAKSQSQQLSELSLSKKSYQDYQSKRQKTSITVPYIDKVVINNDSPLSDEVIASFITAKPGEILDKEILERDIANIYGLNIFQRVSYELVDQLDQTILVINAVHKDWGPNYLRFGMNLEGSGESDLFIGDRSHPTSEYDFNGWHVSFIYDQLDSLNFPKQGQIFSINWSSIEWRSDEEPAAEVDFDALSIEGIGAATWGDNTFILWGDLNGIVDSDTPIESDTVFGGLFNLSGYSRYEPELSGRYAGIARLIYLRLVNNTKSTFKMPIYIGGSLEMAGAWDSTEESGADGFSAGGSLVIGIDTILGPLYLARGYAEGGETENYFFLGRTFTF